jgi:hypothetical protein
MTEVEKPREPFLLPVQKTRRSIEKQLAEHVAKQKDLPKKDQWALKVALQQQAKAHERRQKQDTMLRRSGGWEERRLGSLEYFMYKMKGFVIWCMVDLEGPVTRAVAKGAVLASLKRHAKLRARIIPGQRFQAPPLDVFLKENPDLLIEEPDSDPVGIAGAYAYDRLGYFSMPCVFSRLPLRMGLNVSPCCGYKRQRSTLTSLRLCDLWSAEREMKLNRLAQGKGLPRLWNVYLTGQEGSNQRSAVILVNHALMDGMSLALWLCEIQYIGNEMIVRGGTVRTF